MNAIELNSRIEAMRVKLQKAIDEVGELEIDANAIGLEMMGEECDFDDRGDEATALREARFRDCHKAVSNGKALEKLRHAMQATLAALTTVGCIEA